MVARFLKILTDENISPRVVSFLRGKGLDVINVKEQGWQGSADKFLMAAARFAFELSPPARGRGKK
jgi:predicted nuclease of predicted toxin-antitoxin system